MVSFKTFVNRLAKMESFVRKESTKILNVQKVDVVDMVKAQHHKGVNADNKKMQSGYSSGYKKRRKKKGLQTRFVDQHFTGNYHSKLKAIVTKEGIDIQSGVDYEKHLRSNFPKSVGLTPKNAEQVAKKLAKLLAPKLKKYLVG